MKFSLDRLRKQSEYRWKQKRLYKTQCKGCLEALAEAKREGPGMRFRCFRCDIMIGVHDPDEI